MKEMTAYGKTLPEAYHEALRLLKNFGTVEKITDWDTTCKECGMEIVVTRPTEEPRISRLMIGGPKELQQYVMEMTEGILDFEVMKGNWKYTYHDRMVRYPVAYPEIDAYGFINQIDFVIDELKRNPTSRRAVIVIRNVGADLGSDDPACLQHIQYFVKDGKLDCTVLFRSNDAVKATFMNAFALIKLQEMIAEQIGVDVGTYTHRANNFHCYEKDFKLLEGYVDRILKDNIEDLTYDYEDDWKELMEDYIPDINEAVKALRK